MSISASVRERLLNSFRAELKEHVQTMSDGLLALEQQTVSGEARQELLEQVFRAAHSLKGAARAVGVTMVEQLAHALEDVLDALRHATLTPSAELYTASHQALDAVQNVQAAYEAGALTPPPESVQALVGLAAFRQPTARPAEATPAVSDPPPQSEPPQPRAVPPANLAPPSSPAPAPSGDESIRVKVSKLDALMSQLSELLVTKIRAEQRNIQLRQIEERVALWQKEWLAVRSAYNRVVRQNNDGTGIQHGRDTERLLAYNSRNQELLHELNVLISNLSREYANDTMHMALVIDELEEEIKRVRMLPLGTITSSFGRMVRDLAHEAGKEAFLRIVGGDTELDKRVLEQIKDPLIHILRNAIDHGIETPALRQAAGKPRAGVITLHAEQSGKDVVIEISDDGMGLDLEAVRAAVARHDRAAAEAMNETELRAAIFSSGISTSQIVTDLSGRGVGLDVVRRNVEALRGRIDVDTRPGRGMTFRLTLPLALSSSRGLLVRAAGECFAIPLTHIERIDAIAASAVLALGGYDAVPYQEDVIPLVRLSDVLELPRRSAVRGDSLFNFVVLAAAGRRVAFVVDELAGEQEIVVKGLGRQLEHISGIAGATVMGSGEIMLILDVNDIIKMALRTPHRALLTPSAALTPSTESSAAEVNLAQRHILIVDDSITTRTLEKNILEAAGYLIKLATDGQEAWELIAGGELPDLIVSDISMPRLDGIGLTQRLKNDPRTRQLPVILVTSLDSPKDKARGIEAGADAYITKGAFDQTNLLSTIEQLI